jgi:hypothetical protein
MKKERKPNRKAVLKVFILLLGAMLSALDRALEFFDLPLYENKIAGIWLFILVFFGVMVWHMFDLAKENSLLKSSRPNMVFINTEVKLHKMTEFRHKEKHKPNYYMGTNSADMFYNPILRDVAATTADYYKITEPYSISFIIVENKKLKNQDIVTSLNTHAEMYFYQENLFPIHECVDARWADTVEPTHYWSSPKEKSYYLQKDIAAGTKEKICVVAKQKKDVNCFIFNLDTYNENKLRRRESILGRGKIFVKIILKSANMVDDVVQWFELNNPGSGADIELIMMPKAPKKT